MEVYQLKTLGHQWDVIENNIYSGNLPKCILQKIFTCTYENQNHITCLVSRIANMIKLYFALNMIVSNIESQCSFVMSFIFVNI